MQTPTSGNKHKNLADTAGTSTEGHATAANFSPTKMKQLHSPAHLELSVPTKHELIVVPSHQTTPSSSDRRFGRLRATHYGGLLRRAPLCSLNLWFSLSISLRTPSRMACHEHKLHNGQHQVHGTMKGEKRMQIIKPCARKHRSTGYYGVIATTCSSAFSFMANCWSPKRKRAWCAKCLDNTRLLRSTECYSVEACSRDHRVTWAGFPILSQSCSPKIRRSYVEKSGLRLQRKREGQRTWLRLVYTARRSSSIGNG